MLIIPFRNFNLFFANNMCVCESADEEVRYFDMFARRIKHFRVEFNIKFPITHVCGRRQEGGGENPKIQNFFRHPHNAVTHITTQLASSTRSLRTSQVRKSIELCVLIHVVCPQRWRLLPQ